MLILQSCKVKKELKQPKTELNNQDRLNNKLLTRLLEKNGKKQLPNKRQHLEAFCQSRPQIFSYLRYYQKKSKQNLEARLFKFQRPVKHQLGPEEIENIQKVGCKVILKNHSYYQQSQAQVDESQRPCIFMKMEYVFVEQLASTICGLANQHQGGYILISGQFKGSTISKGLHSFTKKDEQKLRNTVERATGIVTPSRNIRVRVEGVPIYDDLDQVLAGKSSKEFVIRISVARKPGSRDFFFIQHKVHNFKPTYEFNSISRNQAHGEKFVVRKIQGTEIYSLMYDVAKQMLERATKIWKSNDSNSKVSFYLDSFVTQQEKMLNNKLLFANESENFLVSCLQNLVYMYGQQINYYFQKIQGDSAVVQFEINENNNTSSSIKMIEEFLGESKTRYNYVIPLLQFQDELIRFNKLKEPTASTHYVCYFVVGGSYSDFSTGIRKKMGAEFGQRFLMNEVRCKFTLGVPITNYELQAMYNFLWQYFDSIPKVKKLASGSSNSAEDILKIAELCFEKYDMEVAVFTFFFLTLAKKRPYS